MRESHYELSSYAENIDDINDLDVLKKMAIILKMIIQTTETEQYQWFKKVTKFMSENNIGFTFKKEELEEKKKYVQTEAGVIYFIKESNQNHQVNAESSLYVLATQQEQRDHLANKCITFSNRLTNVQAKILTKEHVPLGIAIMENKELNASKE